ncbi:MAG: proteasome assembly chaperone family protein [Candidatus Woesearchaeota archaeon]
MHIHLEQYPEKPNIVGGFPTLGLIGTITTEFLLEHLETVKIGRVVFEKAQPMIAIHKGKIIDPIGIYYNKKHNLVIVHVIAKLDGLEWDIANILIELAKQLDAWQVICLEGVIDAQATEPKIYYYTTHQEGSITQAKPLEEGIVMGVSGALMTKAKDLNITAYFATTHSQLPDSNAAAAVIQVLDANLGLQVDPHPLEEQAVVFEKKLKMLMENSQKSLSEKEKKSMSYVG